MTWWWWLILGFAVGSLYGTFMTHYLRNRREVRR